jgi:hypothetical protein
MNSKNSVCKSSKSSAAEAAQKHTQIDLPINR